MSSSTKLDYWLLNLTNLRKYGKQKQIYQIPTTEIWLTKQVNTWAQHMLHICFFSRPPPPPKAKLVSLTDPLWQKGIDSGLHTTFITSEQIYSMQFAFYFSISRNYVSDYGKYYSILSRPWFLLTFLFYSWKFLLIR